MLKHLVDPLHPTREWPADIKLKCEIGQASLVELSPHANYLAAGLADGTFAVLDADTFSVIYRYRQHSMPLLGIKWSASAEYVVTVGSDWQVCVWDMRAKQLKLSHFLEIAPVAVAFDAQSPFRLALAVDTQIFQVQLSLESGVAVAVEEWCEIPDAEIAQLTCLCILRDGSIAAGTSKGNLHFFGEDRNLLKSLKLSTGSLRAMALAVQRQILAVACSDRSVRVFYLDNGGEIEVGHRFTDLGLQSQWNALAFSQDGEYLYAASDIRQGTVSIWNVLTRFAVRQLRNHAEKLSSLVFDQQRVMLIGAGVNSGAIYVWRAEPPKAWASLIHDFEHIPDIEVYQEKENDWDLVDREIRVSADTEVDVWTLPEEVVEAIIPVDI